MKLSIYFNGGSPPPIVDCDDRQKRRLSLHNKTIFPSSFDDRFTREDRPEFTGMIFFFLLARVG
jgi:hypothetical protein